MFPKKIVFFLVLSLLFIRTNTAFSKEKGKSVLTILTQQGILNKNLIDKFEQKYHCYVRTELASRDNDFEPKMRAKFRPYDLVIANEEVLEKLFLSKLLNPLPKTFLSLQKESPLAHQGTGHNNENYFIPLAADPLGLIMNTRELKQTKGITWNYLINTDQNPKIRQRIHATSHIRIHLLIASLATEQKDPYTELMASSPIIPWLKKLKRQNFLGEQNPIMSLLSHQALVAVSFYSDYLYLQRFEADYSFVIPKPKTYYSRVGMALPTTSTQQILGQELFRYLAEHRTDLEKQSQLVSLESHQFYGSDTSTWMSPNWEFHLSKKTLRVLKKI